MFYIVTFTSIKIIKKKFPPPIELKLQKKKKKEREREREIIPTFTGFGDRIK